MTERTVWYIALLILTIATVVYVVTGAGSPELLAIGALVAFMFYAGGITNG